jgi:hypothetical protein
VNYFVAVWTCVGDEGANEAVVVLPVDLPVGYDVAVVAALALLPSLQEIGVQIHFDSAVAGLEVVSAAVAVGPNAPALGANCPSIRSVQLGNQHPESFVRGSD